jgi:N-methylhydantoinase A
VRRTFEDAYFAQYGVNPSHVPIEVVSWRLTAQGPEDRGQETLVSSGAPGVPKRTLETPLWANAGLAQVYDRASLTRGQRLEGPAVIEERETTIVLPPGWRAVVDDIGCITATRTDETESD